MGNVINFKNNDDEFSEVKSIDEYDDEIESIIADSIDNPIENIPNKYNTDKLQFITTESYLEHLMLSIEITKMNQAKKQRSLNHMKRLTFIAKDIEKRRDKIDDEIMNEINQKLLLAFDLLK